MKYYHLTSNLKFTDQQKTIDDLKLRVEVLETAADHQYDLYEEFWDRGYRVTAGIHHRKWGAYQVQISKLYQEIGEAMRARNGQ